MPQAARRKTTKHQHTTNENVNKFKQKECILLASQGHRFKYSLGLMWVRDLPQAVRILRGYLCYPAAGIWEGESHFLYEEHWHNCMTERNLQEKGQRWGGEGHPFSGSHPSAAQADNN